MQVRVPDPRTSGFAPRDRAWIADGYVSDRWLAISPVTGAVDAFEWKAPVDAIGRGDDSLLIEEHPFVPSPRAPETPALSSPRAETPPETADVVEMVGTRRQCRS
jgi:HemY protein